MESFFSVDGLFFSWPNSLFSFCCQYVHSFYSHIILFGFVVLVIFSLGTYFFSSSFKFSSFGMDGRMIEMFLQVVVVFLLILMAGPGFWLIYYHGSLFYNSELNIKVVGHQWYWSYEYGCSEDLCFDSFMKSLDDLEAGEYRLLDVDNRCVVPFNVNIGFYCTSTDVIHSFCLPKCFIKMDALSGLLSKVSYNFPLLGVFYGQCSEICGAGHSFMPIVVEVTSLECWKGWCYSYFF